MDNEKNHNIKHGGNDIAKYADAINMSCETPEDAHKFWIKEPGGCANQSPEAALTMMNHALRKEPVPFFARACKLLLSFKYL
jgi:hypothetical protein